LAAVSIAPSILAADFSRLEREIEEVQELSTYIHVDVMDGHFVPNITIGPLVANSLKRSRKVNIPLSVHLMISDPWQYGPEFDLDSEDLIIFHLEATDRPNKLIDRLRQTSGKVGISQKPESEVEKVLPLLPHLDEVLVMGVSPGFGGQEFRPEAVERIEYLSRKIDEHDLNLSVAVDGGMNVATIKDVVQAGANVIVAGSAVFGQQDRERAIKQLVKSAEER